MKSLKAFKNSVEIALSGAKLIITGQLWSLIERFESVDPAHIGVAQDPPLCRNCTVALLKPQDNGDETEIARSFSRLKAAAELGCYLCSILYNGTWTPLDPQNLNLPLTQKLADINHPPDLFSCRIDPAEDEYGEATGRFRVEAVAALSDDLTKAWQLKSIILIPEEEMAGDILRTIEPANPADAVAQQTLSWIEECHTTHPSCQSFATSTTWKPTRLIFTGRPDVGLVPRLCKSSDLSPDITYVTLSHCWGLIKVFRLLSTNLVDLLEELPLLELTQVFRDAIDLTRRLGISYIWIDSLCIVQDSVEDWEHESALMGNVYKYSWCNIAATGFENGLLGMYVNRDPSILKPITVNIQIPVPGEDSGTKICKGRFHCMENCWDTDVTNAPLNQRAWVFQERLLSPRVLHLGAHQAFWECSDMEACETFPNGLPIALKSHFKSRMAGLICKSQLATSPLDLSSDNDSDAESIDLENEMLELWWQVVGGYNRGGLTKYEDKLIAIAGVAKEMQVHLDDEYVAGFWKKHLLQHLTWSVAASEADGDWGWAQKAKPQAYQAPSWSWASVNERVENVGGFNSEPLASVLDFKVTLAGTSEFGRVTDGYVRIRGHLTHATFQASDRTLRKKWEDMEIHKLRLKASSSNHTLVVPTLVPDIRVCVPSDVDDGFPSYPTRDAIGSRDFYLLPMCENEAAWWGLLLQRTKSGIRGQYRRLGTFTQLKEEEESFEAFRSHTPFLDVQDYEERDDWGFTISII